MSKRLRQCTPYLRILLSGNQVQSEAVLVTASDAQVNCLSEIFRNVLRLPVGPKTTKLIRLYKKILDIVADAGNSIEKRLKIIQKSAIQLLEVLMSVRKKLLSLL